MFPGIFNQVKAAAAKPKGVFSAGYQFYLATRITGTLILALASVIAIESLLG